MDIKQHYNSISRQYTKLRPPIGADIVAALIKNRIIKQKIKVLDAGCGTGLFTKYLIGHGIRHVTLLDAAEGMVNEANQNLAEEIEMGYIDDIVQVTLPAMPFKDNTFDVVIFSLVLDFLALNNSTGRDLSGICKTLTEARRVLAPDGMISIVTISPRAIFDSIWFMKILPKSAVDRYIQKYPTIPEWESICDESGFQCVNKIGLLGPEVMGPWFYDAEGPIKKEWRNSVSIWNILTDEEIQKAENRIEEIMKSSSLAQFKFENEKSNEIPVVNIIILIPK